MPEAQNQQGWATLPPNVCGLFLGTDVETLHTGAEVCRAWNSIASSCGVRSISLPEDISVKTATRVLNRLAGPACNHLHYQPDEDEQYEPEVLRTIFTDVLPSKFCQIQFLELAVDRTGNWDFVSFLPERLATLSLGFLGNGVIDEQDDWIKEDRDCINSLCVFDRFTELCKLHLTFFTRDLHGFMHVSGDLTLPCLQKLSLHSMEHATELQHLSFLRVPEACELECNSCIHLMDPFGCQKPFTRYKKLDCFGGLYFL